MTTRNYKYGAKPPTANAALVDEQMRLARRYRNRLTEIELQRRERANQALLAASPELVAIESELAQIAERIDAATAEIKRASQTERTRVAATQQQRDELADLRRRRRELASRRKDLRAELFAPESALRAELREIDQDANQSVREARKTCGLYWGTYLIVEEAASAFRRGRPPQFRRWDGSGSVAVQIQGGMTPEEALAGTDTRFRLVPRANDPRRRKHDAWLRVGSTGRDSVWCVVPVVLHRPLPPESRIKWVKLHRRVIGPRAEWSLTVTIEGEPDAFARSATATAGAVAVHPGWRILPDRLRLAVWVGDDGQSGELSAPLERIAHWQRPRGLRSTRDLNFAPTRDAVAGWIASKLETLPEWMREEARTIAQWRSPQRLRRLIDRWRAERIAGDDTIFELAEAWRKQDKHLHLWESSSAVKFARWRDDLYRRFAAQMRSQYARAIMPNTNWQAIMRSPAPDRDQNDHAAKVYQRFASPGRLMQIVREAMAECQAVPAQFTTQRCSACGEIEAFDAAGQVVHQCSHCGAKWDQDHNAAQVMLGLASGSLASVEVV